MTQYSLSLKLSRLIAVFLWISVVALLLAIHLARDEQDGCDPDDEVCISSEEANELHCTRTGLTPHMTQSELDLLQRHIQNADSWFEWGTGGSTYLASKARNIKHIHALEGDRLWIEKLKNQCAVKLALRRGRLRLLHADIGKTKEWGYPVESFRQEWVENYPARIRNATEAKWSHIFIDGRFRTACALYAVTYRHQLAAGVRILMHDFTNRKRFYYQITKYLDIVETAETMAVFKIKPESEIDPEKLALDLIKESASVKR